MGWPARRSGICRAGLSDVCAGLRVFGSERLVSRLAVIGLPGGGELVGFDVLDEVAAQDDDAVGKLGVAEGGRFRSMPGIAEQILEDRRRDLPPT